MSRPLLNLCRSVHVYVTLAAFLLLAFFAVTGFMANHDDWFGVSVRSEREATGKIDPALLAKADRLDIVERLRKDHDIRMGLSSYEAEEQTIRVVFKGPGRLAEADIDRSNGAVQLRFETRGIAGRLNDLHKGANTGPAWRIFIDVTAIALFLGSLTGLLLCVILPGRRRSGLVALGVGLVITLSMLAWHL